MKKGLSILCWITSFMVLANSLFFAVDQETSGMLWDYLVDPAVMVFLGLTVLVNVGDSLRIRNEPGPHTAQLPRDVVTALVAMVGFRYLLQYVAKMAPALEPAEGLWGHLDALVIVILAFEAIALWRSTQRQDHEMAA